MRSKSEMEKRDRYARMYAAVRAAEALIPFRSRGAATIITVEAEDCELWDDIVEFDKATNRRRRHQVKRQLTALPAKSFAEYVVAVAKGDPAVTYCFSYPVPIEVTNVGELRILSDLSDRVKQEGASFDKILVELRPAERQWLESIVNWTGLSAYDALALLKQIEIEFIGEERQLERRARLALEPTYGAAWEKAWKEVLAFVANKDGVVDIHPETLLANLTPPAIDPDIAFYWSIIRRAEVQFGLDRWVGLTDHLATDLLPRWFYQDVLEYVHTVASAAWPGRIPDLEASMQNLAKYAEDYLVFFSRRADLDRGILREDKSYRRSLQGAEVWNEDQAAEAWRRGTTARLINLVVALNSMLESVRQHLDKDFRREGGNLGITDSLGTWDAEYGEGKTYYFKDYVNLP